ASVQIPAMEGDMTVMDNHAPTVTTLRPGIVSLADGESYVVTGGFAEISATGTSILAENALPRGEAAPELLSELLESAKAALEIATDDVEKAAAQMRVNDVQFLINNL
ncbi:MAG: F0F1 ATP synthase subunit epsilon, partial [Pseudomonadota bacterium]